MSKELVKDYVYCGITVCTNLKEIKELVEVLIEEYGESAEVAFDSGYNSIEEKLYYFREETELERQKRLKLEAAKENNRLAQEEKERKEYEDLKAKFEGNQ